MITINFFTTLRLHLRLGEMRLEAAPGLSIEDLLRRIEPMVIEKTGKSFLFKLLNDDGGIKRGTIILLIGRNILDGDGLRSVVNDGETVALFPLGGGG